MSNSDSLALPGASADAGQPRGDEAFAPARAVSEERGEFLVVDPLGVRVQLAKECGALHRLHPPPLYVAVEQFEMAAVDGDIAADGSAKRGRIGQVIHSIILGCQPRECRLD